MSQTRASSTLLRPVDISNQKSTHVDAAPDKSKVTETH